jgi:hypothetical protein
VIVSLCGALACEIGYKNLNWTEDFVRNAQWQGLKSLRENLILSRETALRARKMLCFVSGHDFSRAIND